MMKIGGMAENQHKNRNTKLSSKQIHAGHYDAKVTNGFDKMNAVYMTVNLKDFILFLHVSLGVSMYGTKKYEKKIV